MRQLYVTVILLLTSDIGETSNLAMQAANIIDIAVDSVTANHRYKRQIGPIEGILCVDQCIDSFQEEMQRQTGVDLKQLQQGFFDNSDLFGGNDEGMLNEFCSSYNDTRRCIDDCGEFRRKTEIVDALAPLKFICIDHYDEFIDSMPCFHNTSDVGKKQCAGRCGGEDFLKAQVQKLGGLGQQNQFSGMFGIMNEMCGFIQCQLSCQQPIIEQICGTGKPAKLMQNFIATTMKKATSKLTDAGLGALMPARCRELSDSQFRPKPQTPAPTEFVTTAAPQSITTTTLIVDVTEAEASSQQTPQPELQQQEKTSTTSDSLNALTERKLKLEMQVLEKQLTKLSLEIENLKIQKGLLQARSAQFQG